jgi:hypothetical protein
MSSSPPAVLSQVPKREDACSVLPGPRLASVMLEAPPLVTIFKKEEAGCKVKVELPACALPGPRLVSNSAAVLTVVYGGSDLDLLSDVVA